jgi:hypothetical protein
MNNKRVQATQSTATNYKIIYCDTRENVASNSRPYEETRTRMQVEKHTRHTKKANLPHISTAL